MGNPYGQASRFAYDPTVLVNHLDELPRPASYTDSHHGRIIRRWRRVSGGVTRQAAAKLLADYGSSPEAFELWADYYGHTARLR